MDEMKMQAENISEVPEWDPQKATEIDDQTYEPGTALERVTDYVNAEAIQTFFVELVNNLTGSLGDAWKAYLEKASENAQERQAGIEQPLRDEPLLYTESEARAMVEQALAEYQRGYQDGLAAAKEEVSTERSVTETPLEYPQAVAERPGPLESGLGVLATHTVLEGERLESLAVLHYGDADLWRTIYAANRDVLGGPSDPLSPGQELIIPSVRLEDVQNTQAIAVHQVSSTDTLSGIALQYYGHASLWPLIFDANRATIGDDPNHIGAGMSLVIPSLETYQANAPQTILSAPADLGTSEARMIPLAGEEVKVPDQVLPPEGLIVGDIPIEPAPQVDTSTDNSSSDEGLVPTEKETTTNETLNQNPPDSERQTSEDATEQPKPAPLDPDASTGSGEAIVPGWTETELQELPAKVKAGEIPPQEVSTEALVWLTKNGPFEDFTPELTFEALKRCRQDWESADFINFLYSSPVDSWSQLFQENEIPAMLRPLIENYVNANNPEQPMFGLTILPKSHHTDMYKSDYYKEYEWPSFTFYSDLAGRNVNFNFPILPPDKQTLYNQWANDVCGGRVDNDLERAELKKLWIAHGAYLARVELLDETAWELERGLDGLIDEFIKMPGNLTDVMISELPFMGRPEVEIMNEMYDVETRAHYPSPPQGGGFVGLDNMYNEILDEEEFKDWYIVLPYEKSMEWIDDIPKEDAYIVRPDQQTETGMKKGQVIWIKDILNGTYQEYSGVNRNDIENDSQIWIKVKNIDKDNVWLDNMWSEGEAMLHIPEYRAFDNVVSENPEKYFTGSGQVEWKNYIQSDRLKGESNLVNYSEHYSPIRVPDKEVLGENGLPLVREWEEFDATGNRLTIREFPDKTIQYEYPQTDDYEGDYDPSEEIHQFDYASGRYIEINNVANVYFDINVTDMRTGEKIVEYGHAEYPPKIFSDGTIQYYCEGENQDSPVLYIFEQDPRTKQISFSTNSSGKPEMKL